MGERQEADNGTGPPAQRPDSWLPPGTAEGTLRRPPPTASLSRRPRGRTAANTWTSGGWPASAPWLPRQQQTSAASRTPGYWTLVVIGVVVLVLVLLFVVVISRSVASRPEPPPPLEDFPPGKPSGPPVPQRPVTVPWRIAPDELRPELPKPWFVGPVDGDFSGPYVSAVDPKIADVWLALTENQREDKIVVHGIDPTSGRVLWDHPMEGALCATEADPAGLVCAEMLDRDQSTGLGRRWRLHLLDPRSGETRRSRDVDGWFNVLHRSGDTLIILEQREPAPHAVLRGFDIATLQPRWELDLRQQPGHDRMFTEDRIILRNDPRRDGVVMDRPRFRDVGYDPAAEQTGNDGLVALWAGARTAFVHPRSGKLIMMPHCSRLVDDGQRLWCNETFGAASYSYAGKLLRRVEGPRLAFPSDDGIGVDRNRPVFIDDDGAPVAVDLDTGKVGQPYGVPGAGSVWGLTTMPSAETVGDHTLLVGAGGAMLVDPTEDKISWLNPYITQTDTPVLIKDELLLGGFKLDIVDVRTGDRLATARTEGFNAVALGNRIAGVGSDVLCLQQFG